MIKRITNARNSPLLNQFAMGGRQRKRSMRYLYRIDLLDMENLKFCYGAYMIVNHKDGIVTIYNGSATSVLGIAGRLRQHDAVLKLGYQEVLKRRQMGRQTRVGLIHVVASHPRSDPFFTCMNRYPQFLNCEPLDVKAKFLAVMSESLNVVAMESLDPQILTRQQHYVQQSVILAQLLLGSVRRREWHQRCQPSSTMDSKLRSWPTERFFLGPDKSTPLPVSGTILSANTESRTI